MNFDQSIHFVEWFLSIFYVRSIFVHNSVFFRLVLSPGSGFSRHFWCIFGEVAIFATAPKECPIVMMEVNENEDFLPNQNNLLKGC